MIYNYLLYRDFFNSPKLRRILIPTFSSFSSSFSPLDFWKNCLFFALCLGTLGVLFNALFHFSAWLSMAQLCLGNFLRPLHWSLLINCLSFAQICSALLNFAWAIFWGHCTGAFWAFTLEHIKLPLILSGVCSPSSANYCSNPFEIIFLLLVIKI